jgi:hypothetical protein
MRGGCVIGGSQTPADQHVPNRRTHSVRHGALRLASGTHFTSSETHQETSKGILGLSFGISSAELVFKVSGFVDFGGFTGEATKRPLAIVWFLMHNLLNWLMDKKMAQGNADPHLLQSNSISPRHK